MKTVAVEQGLQNVKQYLESKGCDCVDMPAGQNVGQSVSCCVVTGGDQNVMGMQDTQTQAPVVCAEGLTPEQVYTRIQTYI